MMSLSRGVDIIGFSYESDPEIFGNTSSCSGASFLRSDICRFPTRPVRAPMITDVKIAPNRLGVAHGRMAYSTSHSLPVVLGFVRGRG